LAAENNVNFSGFGWPAKNKPIFSGSYFCWLLEIIFDRYFCRCCQKCEIRQKLFGPIFGDYAQAAEIITDLFSAVFS
jgi:hypothetical protein